MEINTKLSVILSFLSPQLSHHVMTTTVPSFHVASANSSPSNHFPRQLNEATKRKLFMQQKQLNSILFAILFYCHKVITPSSQSQWRLNWIMERRETRGYGKRNE